MSFRLCALLVPIASACGFQSEPSSAPDAGPALSVVEQAVSGGAWKRRCGPPNHAPVRRGQRVQPPQEIPLGSPVQRARMQRAPRAPGSGVRADWRGSPAPR